MAANAVPTWMDAYKQFTSQKEFTDRQKDYGGQIDRPWNSDDGARGVKKSIDDLYKQQLAQYNAVNGTSIQPDASVLGPEAQPNDYNRTQNRQGGLLNQFSEAIGTDSSNGGIGKLGKELTSNPLVNAALVTAGSVFGGPAGAAGANALISRAQGNEWDQVAANAAGAALGSWGIGQVAPGLSGGGVDGVLNTIGAGSSSAPALTGMPIESGGFVSLPSGASGAGSLLSSLGSIGSTIKDGVTGLNGLTGGNLGAIAGGLLGAASGGDTTTSTTSQKDPWKPAQPYLLDNLKKNADLQAQYAANPFNDAQKTAYQNSFNASDNFRNNVAPGLLGMVNSFQPYQRQATAVGGGYKPAAQGGLMSPNMQAPQGQSIGQIDWSKFLPRAQ